MVAESLILVEFYDEKPVGIELPVTVDLKVVDTAPGINRATASELAARREALRQAAQTNGFAESGFGVRLRDQPAGINAATARDQGRVRCGRSAGGCRRGGCRCRG